MKMPSTGIVALLALFAAGCTPHGLQLGTNTLSPTGRARELKADDGYFQIRVQAEITNRDNVITCNNGAARWVERVEASSILVSVDAVVGGEVMTIGVDDAHKSCDQGSASTWRFRPMRQIPGTNSTTEVRVTAVSDKLDNVKIGQIVNDIASTAAFAAGIIGAGPTSGLSVIAAATTDQMQPNLPPAVTSHIKRRAGQSWEVNLERLATNERFIVPITTADTPPRPFGRVTIDTIFLLSLFSDQANPSGTTNFEGIRSEAILATRLEEQNRKRVLDHLRDKIPTLEGLLGEARASGNADKFGEICRRLNDYAHEANFTTRDTSILKWAYLRRVTQFGNAGFWPEACFNEDDRTSLRSMNFSPLPG